MSFDLERGSHETNEDHEDLSESSGSDDDQEGQDGENNDEKGGQYDEEIPSISDLTQNGNSIIRALQIFDLCL